MRLELPPLRPYQLDLVRDRATNVCTVSATQVGKTSAEACWLLARAWEHPSMIHPYWWLAPTYNQVRVGFRYLAALASSAGILSGPPVTSPFPLIRIVNGSVIEFRSWEREQNLMGDPIAAGVVDEAGLLTPTAHAAISSRRSSTLGPLHFIGNPGLVAGPFRRLCSLAEQGDEGYSLHRWTWEDKYRALPAVEAEAFKRFVDGERESLPEFEFRRLYEAEWTEDEAAVFRGLDAVWTRGDDHLLAAGEDEFAIGVDVAQSADYLVAASAAKSSRRLEIRYRVRGVSYQQAAQEVAAIARELGASVTVEENGPGIALIQELQRCGCDVRSVVTTAQTKQEFILSLAADVQAGRVVIADHAPLPHEMSVYRYERGPTGLYRYNAPAGEHDDCVMAGAIAWHAAFKRPYLGLTEYTRSKAEAAKASAAKVA